MTDIATASDGFYICYAFTFSDGPSICQCVNVVTFVQIDLESYCNLPSMNVKVSIGEASKNVCFAFTTLSASTLVICANLTTGDYIGSFKVFPLNLFSQLSVFKKSLDLIVSDALSAVCFAHSFSTETFAQCRDLSNLTIALTNRNPSLYDSPIQLISLSASRDLVLFAFSFVNGQNATVVSLSLLSPTGKLRTYLDILYFVNITRFIIPSHISLAMSADYSMVCSSTAHDGGLADVSCFNAITGVRMATSTFSNEPLPANYGETVIFPDQKSYCSAFAGATCGHLLRCQNTSNVIFLNFTQFDGIGGPDAIATDGVYFGHFMLGNNSALEAFNASAPLSSSKKDYFATNYFKGAVKILPFKSSSIVRSLIRGIASTIAYRQL